MKKNLTKFVLFAMLLLPFMACAQTFEGKGATSPEEAVSQYLSALKKCDYDKIISCYAVESFTENYEINEQVKKFNCATPVMKMIYTKDNLLKQTGKFEVLSAIARMIKFQIWTLNENNFFEDGNVIMVKDSVQEVVDQAFPTEAEKTLSLIEFSNEFIPLDLFLKSMRSGDFSSSVFCYMDSEEIDGRLEELNQKYEKTKIIYGCKDIKPVIACFYISGKKYYYVTDTIQYGNKWYISPEHGYLASLITLSIPSGCIFSADKL